MLIKCNLLQVCVTASSNTWLQMRLMSWLGYFFLLIYKSTSQKNKMVAQNSQESHKNSFFLIYFLSSFFFFFRMRKFYRLAKLGGTWYPHVHNRAQQTKQINRGTPMSLQIMLFPQYPKIRAASWLNAVRLAEPSKLELRRGRTLPCGQAADGTALTLHFPHGHGEASQSEN